MQHRLNYGGKPRSIYSAHLLAIED